VTPSLGATRQSLLLPAPDAVNEAGLFNWIGIVNLEMPYGCGSLKYSQSITLASLVLRVLHSVPASVYARLLAIFT
jgi:hypothetical protein